MSRETGVHVLSPDLSARPRQLQVDTVKPVFPKLRLSPVIPPEVSSDSKNTIRTEARDTFPTSSDRAALAEDSDDYIDPRKQVEEYSYEMKRVKGEFVDTAYDLITLFRAEMAVRDSRLAAQFELIGSLKFELDSLRERLYIFHQNQNSLNLCQVNFRDFCGSSDMQWRDSAAAIERGIAVWRDESKSVEELSSEIEALKRFR